MSTLPAADTQLDSSKQHFEGHAPGLALAAAALSVFGVVSIWPTALFLWALWMTDPLKSIGMFVPVVSLALILRAWRGLHWEMQGSWWGLLLLVSTVVAVRFREQSILVLELSSRWSVYLPPHSLVAFAYVLGAVLLFGGARLYRAARFPIWFVWLVNPVPHIFNVLVDLPLQRISAHVARAFAIALHQKLTPDQMRLMFTPEFGMFIAPGCNGIRGAVTMGMIMLVVGYLYRFRPRVHVALVVAAVLLGYVFNFVRLCTLVLYYIVAMHFTTLQTKAETGDYVIGAALFLLAVGLLSVVVQRAAHGQALGREEDARVPAYAPTSAVLRPELGLRFAAMLLLIVAGAARFAHGTPPAPSASTVYAPPAAAFPDRLGVFERTRSWPETMTGGPVIFEWADYAPSGPGAEDLVHVAVGVSPVMGSHDTSICHAARGEDPMWREQWAATTAAGGTTSFNASFFSSGATQSLEVTTVCNGDHCGEYNAGSTHLGLIYSRPAPRSVFSQEPERPIPVMLKAETADTSLPADVAREQLLRSVRAFLAGVRLEQLTLPYRVR